jgi:hypothetical protein
LAEGRIDRGAQHSGNWGKGPEDADIIGIELFPPVLET